MGYVKIEAIALLLAAFLPAAAYSQSRQLPPGAFAENVEFISFTDLNGHIPFKMSIHQANGRWYMYARRTGRPRVERARHHESGLTHGSELDSRPEEHSHGSGRDRGGQNDHRARKVAEGRGYRSERAL